MDKKEEIARVCDEVGAALNSGKLGDMVAKHEKLIMQYYTDVLEQPKRSFDTANSTARIGFGVLIVTLAWALFFDGLHRFYDPSVMAQSSWTVAIFGAGDLPLNFHPVAIRVSANVL